MGHIIDLARAHVSRKETAKFVGKILQSGCPLLFAQLAIDGGVHTCRGLRRTRRWNSLSRIMYRNVTERRRQLRGPFYSGESMRVFALLCVVALPCLAQSPPPRLVAMQPRLSLSPDYIGFDIQSRCGNDWIFLYNYEWACVGREGDRIKLIQSGWYAGSPPFALWQRLVRAPTATDHRVYMASTNNLIGANTVASIDPISGERAELGFIPSLPTDPVFYALLAGDPHAKLIGKSPGDSRAALISLPGGQPAPFQVLDKWNGHPVAPGQIWQQA